MPGQISGKEGDFTEVAAVSADVIEEGEDAISERVKHEGHTYKISKI